MIWWENDMEKDAGERGGRVCRTMGRTSKSPELGLMLALGELCVLNVCFDVTLYLSIYLESPAFENSIPVGTGYPHARSAPGGRKRGRGQAQARARAGARAHRA